MKLKLKKDLCVGCRACEIMCSFQHFNEFNPKRSRIKVPFTHPLPSFPRYCIQCKKPKCVESCPTGALYRDDSKNLVMYDNSKCNFCLKCIEVCPFGGIFYDKVNQEMLKCDLCNGDPQCVKVCQKKALYL